MGRIRSRIATRSDDPAVFSVDGPSGPVERERVHDEPAAHSVWHLATLLDAQRRRLASEAGENYSLLDLLIVLWRVGEPYELSPGQIARRARVTPAAITRRLNRAEASGLVERKHNPGSQNRKVRLLPAGHAFAERFVHRLAAMENDLLKALDAPERRRLRELLDAAIADIERRYGDPRCADGAPSLAEPES